MYFKPIIILWGLVFCIIAGCNNEAKRLGADGTVVTGDQKTATEYVKAQDYKIFSYNGQVQKYTLDKDKLLYGKTETIPYRQTWGTPKSRTGTVFWNGDSGI